MKAGGIMGHMNAPRGIVMTYSLAMAAGRDAANRRMRKAGRTRWNRADYNEAARTFALLYSVDMYLAEHR